MGEDKGATSGVQRTFMVLRALAQAPAKGVRVTQLAEQLGLTATTTHRLLQSLAAEGMVEQNERDKHYRLALDFFSLAAKAGNASALRDICRPALLRLCASLGDTIFLLVRTGFDAVCVDRVDGPIPIRSFSGDIGGRVPLGVGQAALTILAFLPEGEREEVIRHNLPRIGEMGPYDEVYLRTEVARVRELGYASRSTGLLEGMAGVGVPILNQEGVAVASISVGTIQSRLVDDRLPMVVEMLKRDARYIGERLNPFDVTLRRPMLALSSQFNPPR